MYDRKTLHELLGIAEVRSFPSQPRIVDHGLSEGDMDLGSDEEDGAKQRLLSDHENPDEDGKYHIKRRPGRGNAPNYFDSIAVYTTDDDEDYDEAEEHSADDVEGKLTFQRIKTVAT